MVDLSWGHHSAIAKCGMWYRLQVSQVRCHLSFISSTPVFFCLGVLLIVYSECVICCYIEFLMNLHVVCDFRSTAASSFPRSSPSVSLPPQWYKYCACYPRRSCEEVLLVSHNVIGETQTSRWEPNFNLLLADRCSPHPLLYIVLPWYVQ